MFRLKTAFRFIVISCITLAITGILNCSVTSTITTDADDGIWTMRFTDSDVNTNVTLWNCRIDNYSIQLNTGTEGRTYDFVQSIEHQAYTYVTPLFLPIFNPQRHIIREDEMDPYWHLPKIRKPDGDYTSRSSTIFKKDVVHHFRFKIDIDTIDQLKINWSGKADNDSSIRLFYWNFIGAKQQLIGKWNQVTSTTSKGQPASLISTIDNDKLKNVISTDGFFDVCIVCTPTTMTSCTLYTDYIKLVSTSEEGYVVGTAYAQTTNPIKPQNISNTSNFYWELFKWQDYEKDDATVTYQLLYENSTGQYVPVEDIYLEGNSEGLMSSPVYLNLLPSTYKQLKINATLSTKIETITPKIFSWTLTWQHWDNTIQWQDNFSTEHRIEFTRKIKLVNNNITLSAVTGNWPMFGQNPQNTRASDGKGPTTNQLNWFNITKIGKSVVNPVIADGILFTTYSGSDSLTYLDNLSANGSENNWELPLKNLIIQDNTKNIIAPPTITNTHILVATGSISGSGTSNYIYAIKRNIEFELDWRFDSGENICYLTSPAVSKDHIIIPSWNGVSTPGQEKNRVIALTQDGEFSWQFDIPARSYSTPAIYNDTVAIIGCNNEKDASLFAIDISSGTSRWNASVGAILKASPVVNKDQVFVIGKQGTKTVLTALHMDNGSIIWSKTLVSLNPSADSTPAVYNDVLYVASPDGVIHAIKTDNGDILWSQEVYKRPFNGASLTLSPAYADGAIYIGTPEGKLYALKVSDGSSLFSPFTTFKPEFIPVPIVTSPIVSNGLVLFGDENGILYCLGTYEPPSEELDGYIISIPIHLPTNYWWLRFYAEYTAPPQSSITFSVLDEDNNFIKYIKSGDSIGLDTANLTRVIRLKADLYAKNSSINLTLRKWKITFSSDKASPVFVKGSFTPNVNGWLNEPTPVCSIQVWDNGTGLLVGSSSYTFEYTLHNDTTIQKMTLRPQYTGVNGTNFSTLTADLSALDFSENISSVKSIFFQIRDLANNVATSDLVRFRQDMTKPSSVVNKKINNLRYNTSSVYINATATDPGTSENASGIASVELFYRHSTTKTFSGDWISFGKKNSSKPAWNFTAEEDGGYYELMTQATDVIGNIEDEPTQGDVVIIYDPNKPDIPDLTGDHWFKSLPSISIEFSDDFLLSRIEYRPNFETLWTTIKTNLNQSTYDNEFELKEDYWEIMEVGIPYYLYFRITDSLGNTRSITTESEGYKIIKDLSVPTVDIETPDLEADWSGDQVFTISAFTDDGYEGSGIQQAELFYRYSENNQFDNVSWQVYGEPLTSEPFEWEFNASEGSGYYEFYIRVEDRAGNLAESTVRNIPVIVFQSDLFIALGALAASTILLAIIIIVLWRKKQ